MKQSGAGGFTIVETMIVLAITGVLFITLAAMIAGKQSQAQFKSAMTDVTSQIQSQIHEVSTGYYPSMEDFRCIMSPSTGTPVLLNGAAGLGENSQCTFLGKAVMYGSGTQGWSDAEEYKLHTLVGVRRTLSGTEPMSLTEAGTQVIANGSSYNTASTWPNRSTTKTLQFGTQVAWMCGRGGHGPGCPMKLAGFAIVSAPNAQLAAALNGNLESGSIIPTIIPIPSGSAQVKGVPEPNGVDLILRSLGKATPALTTSSSDGPIKVCFASGTTDQSGLVTIGTNNSTTSVDYVILNSRDCT